LLSREVYDGFDAAIGEREARGEKVKSTFVGIDKAEITHAETNGSEAQITVRIASHLISATYDKADVLIEGDAENVVDLGD
ncbi:Tim44/TimA family putative adaptor protein, partial [Rhizobium leguminosarum]|uniref:Tim44/TimA family putative adaptor protein n=1 Tax=Rhizobium leguminosarum TaxID=384 RepID=UPI003F959F3D